MDIGLREWLIVIGLIVIAGILFDGWRRMRGGKGKLKFKLDRSFANLPDDDGDSAELLGPARVVEHHEPSFDEQDLPSVSARETKERKGGKRQEEPRQGDLDLDEGLALEADPSDAAEPVEPRKGKSKGRKEKEREKAPAVAAEPAPVDEVLIINVIARDESGFKGPALLQNILESGLRFGDMDIFHRHESMAGNGEILFSMANAVKPGTFDLDDIDNFSTRAVSFFLGLPGPRHPKQAFDVMVAAARKLAHELNGELKDEQRSVLTAQTIEHYRQRIIDHERRSLMQKR
ncbi:cell division protein ZipA [Pseudomonas aeruginosa]|uniref:cell division protein ZipA n=1 Tax=Pseudomonas aeruginosa TaxID=287 RepID=UPI001FF1EEF4|nr:cell division protein ZipA [Pseudomonas aeruginosa]MCK1185756.1 cell division protein ZipA [Pseudomonas aeruginosa]HBN9514542.1 cell division protein ZipA [Pseudomonas aeruginosa]HBN9778577.1 cell division protein ZipA [Pseudomonas aeruginosa]HBN9848440.1 cell division protein ZipA [Pseudomonas aeruginosa]HBN9861771.1 cell division protein ZipA [Pseudomonas aeruginosa]